MQQISKNIKYLIFFILLNQLFYVANSANDVAYDSQDSWGGSCSSGTLQSPIDLTDMNNSCESGMVLDIVFTGALTGIEMQYTYSALIEVPSGQTAAEIFATDINGKFQGYDLSRIEIHSPSEHTIDGTQYDVELQLWGTVKSEYSGVSSFKKVAVSFLYQQESSASTFFTAFDISKAGTSATFDFNLQAALNDYDSSLEYMTYQGSRTIPSCAEDVNWYIYNDIHSISETQLQSIKYLFELSEEFANFSGNNREIQDQEDRIIKKGNVECQEQFIYFFSFFILYVFINYFIFKLL